MISRQDNDSWLDTERVVHSFFRYLHRGTHTHKLIEGLRKTCDNVSFAWSLKSEVWSLKHEAWSMKPEVWSLKSEAWSLKIQASSDLS
jgi:hypothetical protein